MSKRETLKIVASINRNWQSRCSYIETTVIDQHGQHSGPSHHFPWEKDSRPELAEYNGLMVMIDEVYTGPFADDRGDGQPPLPL